MPVGWWIINECRSRCLPLSLHQHHDYSPSALGRQFFVLQNLQHSLWLPADDIVNFCLVKLYLLLMLLTEGGDTLPVLQLPHNLIAVPVVGALSFEEVLCGLNGHELCGCSAAIFLCRRLLICCFQLHHLRLLVFLMEI